MRCSQHSHCIKLSLLELAEIAGLHIVQQFGAHAALAGLLADVAVLFAVVAGA